MRDFREARSLNARGCSIAITRARKIAAATWTATSTGTHSEGREPYMSSLDKADIVAVAREVSLIRTGERVSCIQLVHCSSIPSALISVLDFI